jgi:hypothetical protein
VVGRMVLDEEIPVKIDIAFRHYEDLQFNYLCLLLDSLYSVRIPEWEDFFDNTIYDSLETHAHFEDIMM